MKFKLNKYNNIFFDCHLISLASLSENQLIYKLNSLENTF